MSEKVIKMSWRGPCRFLKISGIGASRTHVGVDRFNSSEFTDRPLDVSITTHTGLIRRLLRVVGRGTYNLPTGGTSIPRGVLYCVSPSHLGVIPIVIRRTVS